MTSDFDSVFELVQFRGEYFPVSSLPDRPGDGGHTWWVQIDGAAFTAAERQTEELDETALGAIAAWLDATLWWGERGPAWFGTSHAPVHLSVAGEDVLCSALHSRPDGYVRWLFQHRDTGAAGPFARQNHSRAEVEAIALHWIQNRLPPRYGTGGATG